MTQETKAPDDGKWVRMGAKIVRKGEMTDRGRISSAIVDILTDEGEEMCEFTQHQQKLLDEIEVGKLYNLGGLRTPRATGGFYNPSVRTAVAVSSDVSAPDRPKPGTDKPTDTPKDPVADLYPKDTSSTPPVDPTVILQGMDRGSTRGHLDNLAFEVYFQTEGALVTTIAEVIRDLPKIVALKNQLWLEFSDIPFHNQEFWKFHYCDQHNAYRTRSPRSGRWYHSVEVEGNVGVCTVDWDKDGNEVGRFIPNAKQPQPKPEVVEESAENFLDEGRLV